MDKFKDSKKVAVVAIPLGVIGGFIVAIGYAANVQAMQVMGSA